MYTYFPIKQYGMTNGNLLPSSSVRVYYLDLLSNRELFMFACDSIMRIHFCDVFRVQRQNDQLRNLTTYSTVNCHYNLCRDTN